MHVFTKRFLGILVFLAFTLSAMAQEKATIRGFVYDEVTGEPVMFCNVILKGTSLGTSTNIDGFFTIPSLDPGDYSVFVTFIGYDSIVETLSLKAGEILNLRYYLKESSVQLESVEVSADREEMRTEVRTSVVKVTPKQIESLPSMGGEPDLAQYLQVLPGVVFTGDQGGQLYIRGGTPVQNLTLLDGMIVYQPFHSIGFYSVFETDLIRSADIYSAGYNAEYGGRISSVMDIKTRDGNKNRFAGKASASTFMSKILLEGPLSKDRGNGRSSTFIISAKHSYLEQTGDVFYPYVEQGLPFSFTDIYGKLSTTGPTGSKFNVFGFNFNDRVNYPDIADLGWNSMGFGSSFVLVPARSPVLVEGLFAYSQYEINMDEGDGLSRYSRVDGFNLALNFSYFFQNNKEFRYGIELRGFNTDFLFYNSFGRKLQQESATTELAFYSKYKYSNARWIIEPGIRFHYYASLSTLSLEPRLGVKFAVSEKLRAKAALGIYGQNLIAASTDQDVVNLFYGYLSGSSDIPKTFDGEEVKNQIQSAAHYILGFEYDISERMDLNVEGYVKDFNQVIVLNRYKIFENTQTDKPDILRRDMAIEQGLAYGLDVSLKYATPRWYVWTAYSWAYVERFDGIQTYNPFWDRRHNVNFVATYQLDKEKTWEVSARWNFGTGFPFTQTAGYYESLDLSGGIDEDYTQTNGNLGIIYGELNQGRMPTYHRMDVSTKKTWKLSPTSSLDVNIGLTNVYDRNNIFYFDRIKYQRIDQLPLMYHLSVGYTF